jgi:hypothetical protein
MDSITIPNGSRGCATSAKFLYGGKPTSGTRALCVMSAMIPQLSNTSVLSVVGPELGSSSTSYYQTRIWRPFVMPSTTEHLCKRRSLCHSSPTKCSDGGTAPPGTSSWTKLPSTKIWRDAWYYSRVSTSPSRVRVWSRETVQRHSPSRLYHFPTASRRAVDFNANKG